jgi:transposase InsO family protein
VNRLRELTGPDAQLSSAVRRQAEREVRKAVVAFSRSRPTATYVAKAHALHLQSRTLRGWVSGWQEDRLATRQRGRPVGRADPDAIARLLGLMWVLGPTTGWTTLASYFQEVSRRELRRLLKRARRLWKRLSRKGCLALKWKVAGTVWAMDFTDPPSPVEGQYGKLLLVRDLASGQTLLALPCPDESAETVVAALTSLFLQYGAPLVMKTDNGPAFGSEALAALLSRHRVIWLPSPPHYPQYNGACEAGGGSIKTRAHHLAARAGRPGRWTLDDVEGARLLCNELGQPGGAGGPTPVERWNTRPPIDPCTRDLLSQAVLRALDEESARREMANPPCPLTAGAVPPRRRPDDVEFASRWRAAVARVLVERGLLDFKTRRVSPPISAFLEQVIS